MQGWLPRYWIASHQRLRENGNDAFTGNEDSMPPLVAFAGALGSLAVVRWAYRTARKVTRELEEARLMRATEAYSPKDIPTLRRDPQTGAYRPSS